MRHVPVQDQLRRCGHIAQQSEVAATYHGRHHLDQLGDRGAVVTNTVSLNDRNDFFAFEEVIASFFRRNQERPSTISRNSHSVSHTKSVTTATKGDGNYSSCFART